MTDVTSLTDLAAAADRFALVRDRELFDLIEAVDASIDMIALVAITKLSEREGKLICAALDKAVEVLRRTS